MLENDKMGFLRLVFEAIFGHNVINRHFFRDIHRHFFNDIKKYPRKINKNIFTIK